MNQSAQYQQIDKWLRDADAVLIGAGAGLSAAAGLDYTDTVLFKRLFPGLVKKGFRRFYDLFGYTAWSEAEKWGYLATQVNYVRFRPNTHPIYPRLYDLVKDKNYFVMTSNADGMFLRNNFDPDRLYTPQGTYDRMQCLTPCWRETWESKPIIEKILPTIDPQTHTVTDPTVIPACPNCGEAVFLNVRGGHWFIDDPYQAGYEQLTKWLQLATKKKLLILEVGVGFNTPSVIRWPLEQITYRHQQANFVRINHHYPQVPDEISDRSISLSEDAFDAITEMWRMELAA